MALFETFESWLPGDFAAWQPAKRASNRFTPERGKVRERLRSLVQQALDRQGLDAAPLELWASKPEPHFFNDHSVGHCTALLTRAAADRDALEAAHPQLSAANPEKYHAFAGVRVDESGVTIALTVPALAGADIGAAREKCGQWAAWAELLGWQMPADGAETVEVTRRWSPEEAAAWPDPIGDLGMWLSMALPALKALVGDPPTAAPAAAEPPAPSPATPLPPARTQAPPRAWQPYRPQAPAPPRKVPLEPRPSLADRISPFLQPPREPPPEPPRPWQREPDRRRDEPQRHEPRRDGPDRDGQNRDGPNRDGPRWDDRQSGDRRADPRFADDRRRDERRQPDSRFADDRRRDERQPDPRSRDARPQPPAGPAPGAKVVLVGGLLAGKEGQVVANLGRAIKVRVGTLEFELPPHQVAPA